MPMIGVYAATGTFAAAAHAALAGQ